MAEETKAKKADKKSKSEEQAKDENFRYIVRILNTDVDGNKNIILGLQSVKGVGAKTGAAEKSTRRSFCTASQNH